MKTIYLLSTLCFLTLCSACIGQESSNGNVTAKSINVEPFSKLVINSHCNVILIQSNKEFVEIEADEHITESIKAESKDGCLTIKNTNDSSFKRFKKCTITINFINLYSLNLSNVGNISSTNQIKTDSLNMEISSVGNTHLDLNTRQLTLKNKSVGNVEIKGQCDVAIIKNSSVGNMNMREFTVKKLTINNSSVGNSHVSASEEISIDHSGVGNFTYSGNPVVKELNSSGVGKVSKE